VDSPSDKRNGLFAGVVAYGLWGLLPAFFVLLAPTGPIEIVAWRILFSLVFCLLILAAMRRIPRAFGLLKSPATAIWSAAAAVLILVNWSVYVYASLNQFIVEAALGYFINPLVTVGLGVFLLKEKLRPTQWTSLGLAFVAVIILAVGYGQVPIISLVLAFSFGFYGYVKNRLGPGVKSLDSLTLETVWLSPLALGVIVWLSMKGSLTLGTVSTSHTLLLLALGAVTSIPLLFFGAAIRRLPLSIIGLMQYIAPILQFLFGVVIMSEPMPPERWMGFSLVWVALIVLSVDALRARRNRAHFPAHESQIS
jgi:chloramphenicol-sensitive protein RarD